MLVSRSIVVAAMCTSALALGSCNRNAAAEEPIQVKPGLYEARMRGGRSFGPFPSAAPKQFERKVCVGADEAATFPQSYARRYFTMEDSCGGPLAERTGNLFTGKVICPFDRARVTGHLVIKFQGEVSEESVDVRAVTKIENLQGDPADRDDFEATPLTGDGIELKLSMQRVGDCDA